MSVKGDLKRYVEEFLPEWIKGWEDFEPMDDSDKERQGLAIEILNDVLGDLREILEGQFEFD